MGAAAAHGLAVDLSLRLRHAGFDQGAHHATGRDAGARACRRRLLDAGALIANVFVGDQVDVRWGDAGSLEVGHDLAAWP